VASYCLETGSCRCTLSCIAARLNTRRCWLPVITPPPVLLTFRQPSPTCRTAFPAQHLQPLGVLTQLLVRWPGTHSRILSGIQRAAQTVLGVYLKRTSSRVTSASSALGVLNDYALYKSTHSLTHSCQAGLKTKRPRNCYNGPYGPLIVALPPVTSLRRFSSSDHGIDAGGRYRSINNKQQAGCTSLPLSVYGTDGRTDGHSTVT